MNKLLYSNTVYVVDYTHFNSVYVNHSTPNGVVIGENKYGLLPSFELRNNNHIVLEAVNIENNPGLLKRDDGKLTSQCECFFTAIRHDGGKPWMMFLEMKYCMPKNLRNNVGEALTQLKNTYRFLCDEKQYIARKSVKPYFVIATPEAESLAPFDDFYLDQDDMLSIKEEYDGAIVFHSNVVEVLTAAHLRRPR